MNKKEMIIQTAANIIHEYGYNNIGIKKILDETKIPKGSFYYYFNSKEDLGLSVIDFYIEDTKKNFENLDKTIAGLKFFFQVYFQRFKDLEYRRGCAIGNLVLELADINENFRLKLSEWFYYLQEGICKILQKSSLKDEIDSKSLASFIISNFEGALLKAKLEKNVKPLDEFNYYIFEILLKNREE